MNCLWHWSTPRPRETTRGKKAKTKTTLRTPTGSNTCFSKRSKHKNNKENVREENMRVLKLPLRDKEQNSGIPQLQSYLSKLYNSGKGFCQVGVKQRTALLTVVKRKLLSLSPFCNMWFSLSHSVTCGSLSLSRSRSLSLSLYLSLSSSFSLSLSVLARIRH